MTYSFCYSVPYGVIVLCGGLIGFFRKGSLVSLIMGCVFGGLSLAFGFSAYFKYFESKHTTREEYGGIVLSFILSILMGYRFYDTGKIMPAGLVAIFSIAMTIFFAYRLKNPLPLRKKSKKKE